MTKRWWIVGGVGVVVVVLALLAGPWVYGNFIAKDDAPAASVSTEGAQTAQGDVNGQWTVVPGADPNKTAAGYTVHEILNGASVTVVGTTGDVTGSATVEADKLTAAEFTVQVASITTDSERRDGRFVGDGIMDAAKFPTATFTVDGPVDLSAVPTDGTAGTVSATGTMTIKDVTRPVTVDVKVLRSGDALIASGAVPVTWTDYGVNPPSLGFVTVDPTGTVDFLVSLQK